MSYDFIQISLINISFPVVISFVNHDSFDGSQVQLSIFDQLLACVHRCDDQLGAFLGHVIVENFLNVDEFEPVESLPFSVLKHGVTLVHQLSSGGDDQVFQEFLRD